jgi:energy-coupling factor transport system substrate-specific component
VHRRGSRAPLAYLRSLTGPDGAVRYSRTSRQTPVWVTAQALAALARRPFPLARVARAGASRAQRDTEARRAAAARHERARQRRRSARRAAAAREASVERLLVVRARAAGAVLAELTSIVR